MSTLQLSGSLYPLLAQATAHCISPRTCKRHSGQADVGDHLHFPAFCSCSSHPSSGSRASLPSGRGRGKGTRLCTPGDRTQWGRCSWCAPCAREIRAQVEPQSDRGAGGRATPWVLRLRRVTRPLGFWELQMSPFSPLENRAREAHSWGED